ncbi:uncharacterized protein LOC17883892 [Capsella rubella]|uniref:uncharacterized protein LOC17883892 n=1 Tax=Capsella rubella TaxID=81985 RepID=UPI000CD52FEC|nr:uncharacterized protein LOC17883892 [Capsella rubella]
MTEAGRPPGDPPDGRGVWVQKVVGSNSGGMLIPEEVVPHEFVKTHTKLTFPDGLNGEPVITVGREVMEAMNGLWKKCMVVKVLGRSLSIAVLSRKLKEMWRPQGAMVVTDLPRQFFVVRFEFEEEYMAALTGGPWKMFGSYLMVQAWSPDFDPLRHDIVTMPVWIRLLNIPMNLYHSSILMIIAEGLGKPIREDLTTLKFDRARFARVCVEVDLSQPLKGMVLINEERYYVSYEGLTNICSGCGMYGHLVHTCPRMRVEAGREARQTSPSESREVTTEGENNTGAGRKGQIHDNDGFKVIRRPARRTVEKEPPSRAMGETVTGNSQERNVGSIENITGSGNIAISNRFGGLTEDAEGKESGEVMETNEENKENEDVGNIPRSVRVFQVKETISSGKGLRAQGGGEARKLTGLRSGKGAGPSSKGPKQNKPTRGLVFGPVLSNREMPNPGKRLRTEDEGTGRAGGSFSPVSRSQSSAEGQCTAIALQMEGADGVELGSEKRVAGSSEGMLGLDGSTRLD